MFWKLAVYCPWQTSDPNEAFLYISIYRSGWDFFFHLRTLWGKIKSWFMIQIAYFKSNWAAVMKVDKCAVLSCPLKFLWEKLRAYWSCAGRYRACKCHQRRKGISITAPNHTKGGKCKGTNIFTSTRTTTQKQLPKIPLQIREEWEIESSFPWAVAACYENILKHKSDVMPRGATWWPNSALMKCYTPAPPTKSEVPQMPGPNTLRADVPGCLLGCGVLCISL